MTDKIYFEIKTHVKNLGGQREDDSWSRDSTSTTHDLPSRAYLNEDDAPPYSESFPIDFEIESGERIFLVFVTWSTGDSFGQDDGNCCECFAAYKSAKDALEASKIINNKSSESKIVLPGEDNIIQYTPWNGYFESMDSVDLVEVTVF